MRRIRNPRVGNKLHHEKRQPRWRRDVHVHSRHDLQDSVERRGRATRVGSSAHRRACHRRACAALRAAARAKRQAKPVADLPRPYSTKGDGARLSADIGRDQRPVERGVRTLHQTPDARGKSWHLSTHQGRKTFAYLVAKQDRSGLHALREHLGHRSIVMTDLAYSGHDHDMRALMGEAAMDEMIQAYAEVLTATELAGRAGEEIIKRSPFRGKSSPRTCSNTPSSV